MATLPRVLAVCVNWNGSEVLPGTLDALAASRYPRLETVVVDNASADGSDRLAQERGFRIFRNPSNLGYGGALNRAVSEYLSAPGAEGTPDYFLILNNDVLLEREALGTLVETADSLGAGVCGPKILRADRPSHLEAAWGELTFSHVLCRFQSSNQPDGTAWSRPRKVQLLLGSVLLINRRVFEQIGLFDPDFFMYHEEVDFLYRAEQAGLSTYFCPAARALHIGGHSTRKEPHLKTYWIRKNTLLFLRKHQPGPAAWMRWGTTAAASVAFNLLALRIGRVGAIFRGIRDGLRTPLKGSRR